jgi:hypothetical protein
MKYLAAALAVVVLGILVAVSLLALRTRGGVECPGTVVIVRGRGGQPFECVCVDGVLATCFESGP